MSYVKKQIDDLPDDFGLDATEEQYHRAQMDAEYAAAFNAAEEQRIAEASAGLEFAALCEAYLHAFYTTPGFEQEATPW